MKGKRIAVMSAIAIMSILAGGVSVHASAYKTISSSLVDVNLSGYIGFVKGPSVIKDKIWYTGTLWGSDIEWTDGREGRRVFVTPGTDKKTLSSILLTEDKVQCSASGKKCGYGGTYGKLYMNCTGTEWTLISYSE